jgi:endonuclease YncB( thermonuclease family)
MVVARVRVASGWAREARGPPRGVAGGRGRRQGQVARARGRARAHAHGRWARVVTTVEPVAAASTVRWVFSSLIKHAVYAFGATRKATV